ncbi:hypothetical protein WDW37_13870 [Bdellovibrionota bacterium FG-1]
MNKLLARLLLLTGLVLLGCTTVVIHPCTQGGQPAHEDGKPRKGNKECEQVRDAAGVFVNHGRFKEWFPGGARMLEGEYTAGAKSGKWTEWDEQGLKISEKWFEHGVEVPGREVKPDNGLGIKR